MRNLEEEAPFDVRLPDAEDKVFFSETGTVQVCRRSVCDVRQNSEPSAVWTIATNPERSVSCGRAELINVVE